MNAPHRFGFALAADDGWVAVGAPFQDTGASQAGAVYLYEKSASTLPDPPLVARQTLTAPQPRARSLGSRTDATGLTSRVRLVSRSRHEEWLGSRLTAAGRGPLEDVEPDGLPYGVAAFPSVYHPRCSPASLLWRIAHCSWYELFPVTRKSTAPPWARSGPNPSPPFRLSCAAATLPQASPASSAPAAATSTWLALTGKARHLCPACHQRRTLQSSRWIAHHVCLPVPHRPFVFTWVVTHHDPELIRELNAALREGRYAADFWSQRTQKSLETLAADWKASLAPPAEIKSENPCRGGNRLIKTKLANVRLSHENT